jgi:hypothetical protein
MSPEVEAAFPEQAQALYAGSQVLYQHPATVDDVCRYPSVGRNAYNEEEVRWFEATYDYLEAQLDDAELAKRMLPAKKQRRGARRPSRAFSRGGGGEREPLRGPHARMTLRTTTRLFSRHPVPGREGAKQGRRFYVPKQRLYVLCIFYIFVIFCTSDIFCIFAY